ncbi:MAG TPA: lipopolysaccharide transport periplasmic protein LptA [Burkholderiales bacterium]|nr:lipopolysaccharide transport periplasmic protein LptA [Burkholderiales bacterium]
MRARLSRALVPLCASLALVAAPAAHAEKADRNKPIHVEADRATVDDAKQIMTLTGNVVITQGTTVLRGDKVQVRQDKDGFKSGTVWGNLAYFKQKREGTEELIEGWSERIEYDSRADKVEMFNRALMKRGPDEVRGSYISYDVNTEFYQVQGGGTKAASARPAEGRVKMVLNPKPKEGATPPAPAAVPLKPDAGADVPRGETGAGK